MEKLLVSLLLFCVYPIAFGQHFIMDSKGMINYLVKQGGKTLLKPTCLINYDFTLPRCSTQETPVLMVEEQHPLSYQHILPYYINSGMTTSYDVYPYEQNYYELKKEFGYEKGDDLDDIIDGIKKKKKSKKPIVDIDDELGFRFRKSLDSLPSIIPVKVTNCIPDNNILCNPNHIMTYRTYLRNRRSASDEVTEESIQDNETTKTKDIEVLEEDSTNKKQADLDTNEEDDLNTKKIEIDINDDSSLVKKDEVETLNFAQLVGTTIVSELQKQKSTQCPTYLKHLTVKILNMNEDGPPKLRVTLDMVVDDAQQTILNSDLQDQSTIQIDPTARKSGLFARTSLKNERLGETLSKFNKPIYTRIHFVKATPINTDLDE